MFTDKVQLHNTQTYSQKTFRNICCFIIDNFSHFDTQLLRKFVCSSMFDMRLAFEVMKVKAAS